MSGDLPVGGDVFVEFCRAGLWPGVGPALSEQLVAAGIHGPSQVSEEALAALPRVTDKRARRLYSAWIAAAPSFEAAQVLVPHGLPVRWARRAVDLLGSAAAELIAGDPWQLLAIREASVTQIDDVARALYPDVTRDDPRRTRALVGRALADAARNGHTATPLALLADALRTSSVGSAADALAAAVGAGLAERVPDPTGGGDTWVATPDLALAERDIARRLTGLAAAARPLADANAIARVIGDLDDVQASAITAAANAGVSVLTGGPGTGKSRTVAALVRLCTARGLEIALAAPTGRAAKRLTELAADSATTVATTVHRLLGARRAAGGEGSIFDRDEDNPIEADVVVVDEASMLDVPLAAALLRAIPDGAHLLIVGDPAQLPAIGPGTVLRDILAADSFPVTTLETLYRQTEGGAIAKLATAVRGGALAPVDAADHEVALVPADGSPVAAQRVRQLVTDSIPRTFALGGEDIQVVTPIHRGPAGTMALNGILKEALNPGRGTVRGFDVGDRVVATANHLDAEPVGFANGEVGTVIEAAGKSVTVAFPSGNAEVSGTALGDLVHGWAITVHRAQGSEWEAVVVVLPPEAGHMLSRPLIYTAMTRAKRHLSIVHAAGPAVAYAVRNVGARPRRSLLRYLLTR